MSTAFAARPDEDVVAEARRRFALAFEPEVFMQALAEAHPEFADRPAADATALYLSRPEFARLDANAMFNEAWYRRANPDVAEAIADSRTISGLFHWVTLGSAEGRFPSYAVEARAALRGQPLPAPDPAGFDAAAYLAGNAEARLFLRHFRHLDAYAYASGLGRWLDPPPAPEPVVVQVLAEEGADPLLTPVLALMRTEFDEDWYFAEYLAREEGKENWVDPWGHYVRHGLRKGYSPSARFCEGWYLAFHPDVREAVRAGDLVCGFHHWLVTGRDEGRSPRFELAAALESTIPGVTAPALLERARALSDRLAPMPCRVEAARPRTLWVVLPRLNPDISFGGFRALFELVAALRPWAERRGLRLSLLTLEEPRANPDYFLWRTANPRLRRAFSGLEVRSRHEVDRLEIGPQDRFLAYSSWDVIFASPLAKLTDEPRVISLVQEYEPIFHDYGAVRAVSDWAFQLPSYPLFNSAALRDFFATEDLGLFRAKAHAQPGEDYAVFEHVVQRLPHQSAADMRARRTRQCAIYARPEGHAARNLYELVELALKELCGRGAFDGRWSFTGLGCLAPTPPVDLGGGRRLVFAPKLGETEYAALVRQLDLGISLMYAPHPSVMPFEFATTGAMVVTNTFSNRPAGWFEGVSRNIVAGEPTVPGVVAAIEAALARVDDFDARAANAYSPAVADWPQVFDVAFLEDTVGRLL
ncbi:MAG: hypothetical protein INR64_06170 [Caulobacteraceae bacterium]|nr:hypothetical protein [Caulobacter sp.]